MWDRKHAGSSFRQLRLARGLSQETVAQRAGMTSGYVSRFEHGDFVKPSYTTLAQLAGALGLSGADELVAHFGQRLELVELRAAASVADDLAHIWRLIPEEARVEARAAAIETLRAFQPVLSGTDPVSRRRRARSATTSATGVGAPRLAV